MIYATYFMGEVSSQFTKAKVRVGSQLLVIEISFIQNNTGLAYANQLI
jgi:hypothetical protein